jgi:high-affinity iron transporter
LLFFSTVYAGPASAASDDARQLWQLLDYVAVDYGGAVANGTVISEAEYAEMKDFTEKATKQVQALPAHASKDAIAAAIGELRAAVLRKADGTEVARLAQQANALLLAAYPMPVAPRALPDLTRGGALYIAQCASCHGAAGRGDGRLAASLEPKPIAFTDPERARSRSLMALYQVVTQGVAGTSMPSFSSLSEEDRWALAFYIGTMSHDGAMRGRGEKLWRQDASVKRHFPDLATVSTMTEAASAKLMPQCRRDQHV